MTDQRKNSNNLYRFFWNDRDYVEREREGGGERERTSIDCRAIVVAILDKQLSEYCAFKNAAIPILNG